MPRPAQVLHDLAQFVQLGGNAARTVRRVMPSRGHASSSVSASRTCCTGAKGLRSEARAADLGRLSTWSDASDLRTSRPWSARPTPASTRRGRRRRAVPISAAVFREGHDAVGANVVLRDPGGRKAAVDPDGPGRAGHRPLARHRRRRPARPVDLRRRGVERSALDLAPRGHAQDRRRPGRRGPGQRPRGRRPALRPAGQVAARSDERPRAAAAAKALRDTTLDLAHRVAPALDDVPAGTRATTFPVRELVTRSPRYAVWVDRQPGPVRLAGTSSSRARSARSSPATRPRRPGRSGTARSRTPTEHLDYVAALGFDVVYLPPIHPIGEVNRKGPNNTLIAASWDVGSPWAIGSRDGGHDAIHPELGTMADFEALRGARQRARHGGRARLRAAGAPDHPWVDIAPGVVHHRARRHDRLRREPAEEVPGHLPAQLRQRPRGHLRRVPADRAALGRRRREDLPRRQPAHQAAQLLALADRRGQDRTPTCCSWPRRSPGRR